MSARWRKMAFASFSCPTGRCCRGHPGGLRGIGCCGRLRHSTALGFWTPWDLELWCRLQGQPKGPEKGPLSNGPCGCSGCTLGACGSLGEADAQRKDRTARLCQVACSRCSQRTHPGIPHLGDTMHDMPSTTWRRGELFVRTDDVSRMSSEQ